MASRADREAAVLEAAPHFTERPNLLRRLVNDPAPGNAWHADHILMVAEGGGECGTDNARTLCVLCHASVTAEQVRAGRGHKRRQRGGGAGGGGGDGAGVGLEDCGESPTKRARGSLSASALASAGAGAMEGDEGSQASGGEVGSEQDKETLPPGKMWLFDAMGRRHVVDALAAEEEAEAEADGEPG